MDLKGIFKTNKNKIDIKVKPNANLEKIVILEVGENHQVKVYVTVTMEDSKSRNKTIAVED